MRKIKGGMEKVETIEKVETTKAVVSDKEKTKISFAEYVFIYMLGGLVGSIHEMLLNLVKGKGFTFCNGSIITPFNFVYGAGAVFIIMLLHNRRKIYEVYLLGALGGGFIEYVLSFLAEKILGAVFWDYSKLPLNINGRTTIPIMLFWGLLCVAVVFGIYRPLDKILKKIPPKTALIIAIIMTVIIVFDLSLVMLAVFRYGRRAAGVEAVTLIGRFADGVFNDSFMALRFPTVKF